MTHSVWLSSNMAALPVPVKMASGAQAIAANGSQPKTSPNPHG